MNGLAYYNEIDPFAAQWLRELINAGHIAPGIVDERSIEDVKPSDVIGFTQCHFFAGIGVWSHALRSAGWPDDKPVWTMSCPCQPFSSAGQGKGVNDERHLWPAAAWLIKQCQPVEIFGEQVGNKSGETWLDFVQADLENEGYASGATVTAACGFGAPHQRKRMYWVAYSEHAGPCGSKGAPSEQGGYGENLRVPVGDSDACKLDNSRKSGRHERRGGLSEKGSDGVIGADVVDSGSSGPHPTNGHWRDPDWISCRDGKFRPVEPGTFPLVDGAPARVGRLRGYGNAIVSQQAQAFIESYQEVMSDETAST